MSPASLPAGWVSATERARPSLLTHPERVVEAAWHAAR
jgi:hypothetical protein